MTATVVDTAAPSYAVKVWADHRNIYAEVPSLNQPCVLAFRLSEGGLSQVLSLLGARLRDEGGGQPYLRPPVISKNMIKEGVTTLDLDSARMALIALGILK